MARKKGRIHPSQHPRSYVNILRGAFTVIILFIILFTSLKFLAHRQKGEISPEAASTEASVQGSNPNEYVVQAGDSLWSIAQAKYADGYEWVTIANANNLDNPDAIDVGQKLAIPKSSKETKASKKLYGNTYTVLEGDSLWSIAEQVYKDGYRWTDIARVNSLFNPDLIYSGNIFKLPK